MNLALQQGCKVLPSFELLLLHKSQASVHEKLVSYKQHGYTICLNIFEVAI